MIAKAGKRVKAALAWWKNSRPGRSLARFGEANGPILSGGIAYAALFSFFAILTLGWTVLSWIVSGNERLRTTLLEQVDEFVPGLLDNGDGGVIDPDTLIIDSPFSLASLIAIAVLLWSAIAAMSALRSAVRTVLGEEEQEKAAIGKLKDLGILLFLGAGLLLTVAIGLAATSVTQWLLQAAGLTGIASTLLPIVGLIIGLLGDMTAVCFIVWVFADRRPAWRDMLQGALIAGVILSAIRFLGTSVVVGSAASNPMLAPFATIITLLVVVNFVTRIMLMGVAWMAEGRGDAKRSMPQIASRTRRERRLVGRRAAVTSHG